MKSVIDYVNSFCEPLRSIYKAAKNNGAVFSAILGATCLSFCNVAFAYFQLRTFELTWQTVFLVVLLTCFIWCVFISLLKIEDFDGKVK